MLFWISSGSFCMKYNMLCKLKRFECLIWSSFLFSTESFCCWEKAAFTCLKSETKSGYRIFQKTFCALYVTLLNVYFHSILLWHNCWYMAEENVQYRNEILGIYFLFLNICQEKKKKVSKNSLNSYINEGVEYLYSWANMNGTWKNGY